MKHIHERVHSEAVLKLKTIQGDDV